MGYSQVALGDKIRDIYPEIEGGGLSLKLSFDDEKNAWVIVFEKGNHRRYAFLDKKDADSCMDGNVCMYLGTLLGFYVKDLEAELGGNLSH